ncbi:uncharacterized protein LOC111829541 [Capsella rubella]|uniref:uncharacterized protein LOC111829541 n=1 Tax=Capsella rubella TaxID=81985 RepID=UPI000CD4B18C|nr:uncharacterized protein LOC111829541 [Capsella rubella]
MENSELVDNLLLPNGIYEDGSEPFSQASIIQHTDNKLIWRVKAVLSDESFKQLEVSFLGHIIKIASKSFKFSGKLFHYIMMRRLKTKGNILWFRIASQPTRFSMREFFLSTDQSRKGKKPAKKPYTWTSRKDLNLSKLEDYLFSEPKDISDLEKTEETEAPMEEDEKLCLAAVILTEGFLMMPHSLERIPSSKLHHASNFEAYTSLAWGKDGYQYVGERPI